MDDPGMSSIFRRCSAADADGVGKSGMEGCVLPELRIDRFMKLWYDVGVLN